MEKIINGFEPYEGFPLSSRFQGNIKGESWEKIDEKVKMRINQNSYFIKNGKQLIFSLFKQSNSSARMVSKSLEVTRRQPSKYSSQTRKNPIQSQQVRESLSKQANRKRTHTESRCYRLVQFQNKKNERDNLFLPGILEQGKKIILKKSREKFLSASVNTLKKQRQEQFTSDEMKENMINSILVCKNIFQNHPKTKIDHVQPPLRLFRPQPVKKIKKLKI